LGFRGFVVRVEGARVSLSGVGVDHGDDRLRVQRHSLVRCRANSAQMKQSRPGSGLGSSHFSGRCLDNLSSCSLLAHQWSPGLCTRLRLPPPLEPLSRKLGTNKPVKARFWPWLEPFSVRKSLKPIEVVHSPPAIGLASEPNAPNRSTRAGEETLKWLRTSPLLSQSGLLFDPVTPAPPLLALNPTPQNPEP